MKSSSQFLKIKNKLTLFSEGDTNSRADVPGIWSVGFCGGRKTEEPGEKPSEQG